MLTDKSIIYSKDCYIVFRGSEGEFVVYNTKKPFKKGHSHLESKKRVKKVIENSIKKHFPLHWSSYFIETMQRLTTDKNFYSRLEKLKETRKNKDRKNMYINIGGRQI